MVLMHEFRLSPGPEHRVVQPDVTALRGLEPSNQHHLQALPLAISWSPVNYISLSETLMKVGILSPT